MEAWTFPPGTGGSAGQTLRTMGDVAMTLSAGASVEFPLSQRKTCSNVDTGSRHALGIVMGGMSIRLPDASAGSEPGEQPEREGRRAIGTRADIPVRRSRR